MTDLVRQKLQTLISQFGLSVCNDVKRCEALLKDLCPQNKREVRLLVIALGDGAVKKLNQPSSLMTTESLIAQLVQSLDKNWGIASHHAQWAVESWALVLGVEFNSSVIAPAPDNSKVGVGVPKSVEPIKSINQPSQAIIEQFKGWQKIGLNGEKLAADAPHWAAAIDKKTQLMWAINPSKTANFPNPNKGMNWEDAVAWAKYVNTQGWCGFNDWRLPTIDELKTLFIKHRQPTLHLNEAIFNDTNKYYGVWSSSPVASYSNYAWIVNFSLGLDYFSVKSNNYYVRLVRSSQ